MAEAFVNYAASALDGSILAGDLSLTLTVATGFPDPASGAYRIRIGSEILTVTAISGLVLTVGRGAEGTTAAGHASGAAVEIVLTAGALDDKLTDYATASDLTSHTGNTSNPHSVTKTQVGLSNVTNDAQLKASDLDDDTALAADSATKVPTQHAVKAYVDAAAPTVVRTIGAVFDGGGSALVAGLSCVVRVPFACTIQSVTMMADASGSAVVGVWKGDLAHYPPTIADAIHSATPPTLSSQASSEDTTLSGWITSVSAGDVIKFHLTSVSGISRLSVELKAQ